MIGVPFQDDLAWSEDAAWVQRLGAACLLEERALADADAVLAHCTSRRAAFAQSVRASTVQPGHG